MTYNVMMFHRGSNTLMYELPVHAYSADDAITRASNLLRSQGKWMSLYPGSAYPK